MTTEQYHVANPGRRFLDPFVAGREVFETSPAFIYGTPQFPFPNTRDPVVFSADGYVRQARADTASYRPATAISTGTTGIFQLSGIVDGFVGLIPMSVYYLGATGGITNTAPVPPTLRQPIGIAKSATELILAWNAAPDATSSVSRWRTMFSGGDYSQNYGCYRVNEIAGTGLQRYSFAVPLDFGSLISLSVIAIPQATFTSKKIYLYSNFGTLGEAYNFNALTDLTKIYSGVAGIFFSIDISSVFVGIGVGDLCGIEIDLQAIGATIRTLGVKMDYWSL